MIQIAYDPHALQLSVTGHSGADVSGRDIVCAGVSALVCTLGEAVRRLDMRGVLEEYSLQLCHGQGEICCKPQPGFACLVRTVVESFVLGLELLAVEYPDRVMFTQIHSGRQVAAPTGMEKL